MQDWNAFAAARRQAHQAVQWAARAARANLPAAPDDSHSSLTWDEPRGALLSQPLPGGLRIGLGVAALELLAVGDDDVFRLAGATDADAGAWTDTLLHRHGLAPATTLTLPYQIESATYATLDAVALADLALWFSAAATALEALRLSIGGLHPGPSPVRLWPHHFDIATLVGLEEGNPETARSIGAGVSMGDAYYAQPYAYVSPWPRPDAAWLPAAPRGGHWHTQDFVSIVASADELLAQGKPEEVLPAFFAEAYRVAKQTLRG